MKYDLIVIGGGPAGIISAMTARKKNPKKKILLVKSIGEGVIPCAIPYMINTLEKCDQNAVPDDELIKNKIQIKVDEVVQIDKSKKIIATKSNETFSYDKLILATGSNPIFPPLKGKEKRGIYTIKKDMIYLKNLKREILKAKDIVIVGGGFIGVEFADEVADLKNVKNVTLIELLPELISVSFDKEYCEVARAELENRGVKVMTEAKVVEFLGNEKVSAVLLGNGKKIKADLVLLGIGASPNSKLAEKAGLKIEKGFIRVDGYQNTSDKDIFAIGDCSSKKDFFSGRQSRVMLASVACEEARVSGLNVFKKYINNTPVVAVFSTKIGNTALGSAGLNESAAKELKMSTVAGIAECPDKHPGSLPQTKKIRLKLLFEKKTGVIVGGQLSGGDSVGELVNIIGLAVQKKMKAADFITLIFGTHPKLTGPPTKYPISMAAQDAIRHLSRR